MIRIYEHQAEIKNLIGPGDFIYFAEPCCGINSGEVEAIDRDSGKIKIANINGEGETMELSLTELTLYYDTNWRR